MTTIHDDPARFTEDQLAGFLDLYADRLRGVPGGVVAHRGGAPRVGVVVGGGSGHYPAFCGTVGPGLASGAVVGNVFTSPSATQAYSVGRAADEGRGVVFSFGNYMGDRLNFGLAAERLRAAGVDTRIVLVTDDIASADVEADRRGIAGDFVVFKILGAASAAGLPIDEVERLGRVANAATRTLGVAFSGCTLPGAAEPLFEVPTGQMGLGLGIHGEPGIRDVPVLPAADLAALLVDDVLKAAPVGAGARVGALLNGLGTTKYEELFLLWGHVTRRLRAAGLQVVDPEVGELVTSLDMGGCSLTLTWLDAETEPLWRADAYTPAYRKAGAPLAGLARGELPESPTGAAGSVEATPTPLGDAVRDGITRAEDVLRAHAAELGRIDAVAGDGDHGRGMVKGVSAARAAAGTGSAALVLQRAGRAWADDAGGTSGVLWGAALEAAARPLGDEWSTAVALECARAFRDAMASLGGARPGDKTLLDAVGPFVEALEARVDQPPAQAWAAAAEVARTAAEATRDLLPQVGRARPLAERSKGTPDPGATSFALVVGALVGTTPGTTGGS